MLPPFRSPDTACDLKPGTLLAEGQGGCGDGADAEDDDPDRLGAARRGGRVSDGTLLSVRSEPACFVHDVQQLVTGREAPGVLDEHRVATLLDVRTCHSGMGCEDNVRRRPQWVIGW